ncbi:MAG: hypothetical protein H8D67_11610 [Deltaproteobacteria bacterium]|nr:hypothetical protein [Deltaproteobacteria bacterium]
MPEIKMKLSDAIFLGFLPKKITLCPEWLKVPHIKQICSVSQCVSPRPPNMFETEEWNYNRAGLYNDFKSAFDAIPPGEKDKYEIFVYKVYSIQIDKDGIHEIDVLKHIPGLPEEINPEPDLTGFHRIGYDIVEGIRNLSFGCSPLSCNSLAGRFKVNEFCLIDDLHYAIEAGVTIAASCAGEPPPYYPFEVYRKTYK